MLSQQEMDDFMEGEAAPAEPVDSNVKRRKLSEPAQTDGKTIIHTVLLCPGIEALAASAI